MYALTLLGATAYTPGSYAPRLSPEAEVPHHDHSTSSWLREERASPQARVTLTVALRVEGEALKRLESTFWAVSTPGDPEYGKHLSNDQVTALLNVSHERVSAASHHFAAAGAEVTVAPNRDMLTVVMTAAEAEALLSARLHWYRHSRVKAAPRLLRAAAGYSLDASVAQHVSLVGELVQFPHIAEKATTDAAEPASFSAAGGEEWPKGCAAAQCDNFVTPAVLAMRYKIPAAAASSSTASSMAVAEYQGQYYKTSDLATFGESCKVDVSIKETIGGDLPVAGVEAELDIEYIKAVAPAVPLTVVYNSQYSLLAWARQISSLENPPLVHSVSYGNDEKQQVSAEYMQTANTAFMKAGARGLSILFASGDQGVCGREGCGFFKKRFKPDFPAASPYITAVGGTDFVTKSVVGDEKAWVAGGGGFSDDFAIPAYQAEAVAAYLSQPDLPPKDMWNSTGRAYPDVSALAGQVNPYCVVSSGRFAGVAGTSAACPVVAGIFALLNSRRVDNGKPALGFLNPFIYKNPQGFQDVTQGKNTGGMQEYGFSAVKGWDAATGFGTPDFDALAEAVDQL
mmetsp:Transcript_31066/g.99728  ORF Transcript_31066/g.99728 Transcript_31066/m.99728 type:complete len:570 (+) Transcript_31066:64-1773(+)